MKLNDIPDVQSAHDAWRVRDRSGHSQGSVAVFDMQVDLPQHFKGTHMSRFGEMIERTARGQLCSST
ncbi:GTP cyclohydrolase, FolE2/MptA family [Aromatoleum toluclasticum]|uniref:GTP cyclohydrolase, FolE2/MptA family n=1 Tax=Aromatoleum toluclasticum TaxID=92003 RepID=UPI000370C96E|nr:GTP cyclohydrolase, FolE2/MptA family [Aromatoleum toluclasticum]MCC4117583.1 GTP cyclohydrolase, FolE2/MptA family [Aromatoleum toluclasticum]